MPKEDFQKFEAAIARIHHQNGDIAGAGFLVSDHYVLTCAHVVASVLNIPDNTQDIPGDILELDFPLDAVQREVIAKKLKAKVIVWFPEGSSPTSEDVAILQLLEAPPYPIQPVEFQVVSDFQNNHLFKLFGFPAGHPNGLWAQARSSGGLGNGWVQMEDDKTQGVSVEPGFSGTPIWDTSTHGVVGMTVARDKSRLEAKIAFMMPKKSLFPVLRALDVHTLRELLGATGQDQTVIKRAYRICCSGKLPQSASTDIPSILTELRDMPEGSTGSSAVLQFAACLVIDQEVQSSVRENLRQWIKTKAENVEGLLEWATQQLAEWNSRRLPTESHLLVKVQPSPQKVDYYFVEAWLIPDLGCYDPKSGAGSDKLSVPENEELAIPLEALPARLKHFLSESRAYELTDLAIDVFLPLKLLSHPVDTCSLQDELGFSVLLGSEHRVLVRSYERLAHNYAYKGAWKAKWERLQSIQSLACDILQSLNPNQTLNQQVPSLSRPEVIGLHLITPPQTGTGSELALIQRTGIPIALWLRRSLTGSDCQTEINQLLGCCIHQLPNQVKEKRQEAFQQVEVPQNADNDPIGHHLSLLWEDVNRVPPDTIYSSAAL
jgi:hypothetical protein